MSPKQVPETTQLPIPEQMERLKTWVNGHRKLFELYRSGGPRSGLGNVQLLRPVRSISPTADLRWYDEMVGDARVFRNALAVFHRDGCSVAAEILSGMLHGSTDQWERPIKLPYEDELPNELEPMVLLIFEPEKMFPIMQWHRNSFMQLFDLWGERGRRNEVDDETRLIVNMLPSLQKHWEALKYRPLTYGKELFQAIAEDILGPFGGVQEWFDPRHRCPTTAAALYTGEQWKRARTDEHVYAHQAYDGVAFAYLLRNVHQRDVLARIPRNLQGRVATWQFEVYLKSWFGIPEHKIMFIPETELQCWQGIHKSSLSKGVSSGYVAVYKPEKVFQSLPDGQLRDEKSTLVLNNG
jgi:hypothetical protein